MERCSWEAIRLGDTVEVQIPKIDQFKKQTISNWFHPVATPSAEVLVVPGVTTRDQENKGTDLQPDERELPQAERRTVDGRNDASGIEFSFQQF